MTDFNYDNLNKLVRDVVDPLLISERNLSKDEISKLQDEISQIQNKLTQLETKITKVEDSFSQQISNLQQTITSLTTICVGTIVIWPTATNPSDLYSSDGKLNWMECNGQFFEIAAYQDLYIALGQTNRVPDYRGLFLRGYGSQTHIQNNGSLIGNTRTTHTSGQLGQIQGDAIRNIYGEVQAAGFEERDDIHSRVTGCCYINQKYDIGSPGGEDFDYGFGLDASRIVPTANEVRVVNTAVRYLIRSLP